VNFVPRPSLLDGLDLTRSGVLEASAGTGKTYAIEHIVLDLVLGGEPLDQILLITFTDKAASELKVRIRKLLTDLPRHVRTEGPGWPFDARADELRRDALVQLGRAQISTIHGFCRRMLREFAFEGGRPFDLELVDEREALATAARKLLRRASADHPVTPWIMAWLQHTEVREMVETWVQIAERRAPVEPEFDPDRWADAIESWGASEALLRGLAGSIPRMELPRGAKSILRNTVVPLQRGAAKVHTNPDPARALRSVHEIATVDRRRAWDRHREVLRAKAPSAVAVIDRLLAAPPFEAAACHVILPALYAAEARVKSDRGWTTFFDMTAGLAQALNDTLIERIRRRFLVCLVDEFQDTDATQWEILRRVFFDSPEHRLVVVGDPKQSIYGFRGADLETYREATDAIREAGGFVSALTETRRSSPAVTEAVHSLLSAQGHAFWSGQLPYVPVTSARTEATGIRSKTRLEPALTVWTFDTLDDGVTPTRRAWARAIAEDAARLLAGGNVEGRPLQPKDLFVLTRTTSEARQVATALRHKGLSVVRFDRGSVGEGVELSHLRSLLAALEHPEDRAAERRAWLTPWFGLPPDALDRGLDLPADHPWLERLAQLRARRRRGPAYRLVANLWTPELASRCAAHPDRYGDPDTHAELFDELARVAANAGWPGVHRWLERARPKTRSEPPDDAVRVSTIHGAKGLEAECVYVFGGLKSGDSTPPMVRRPTGFRVVLGPTPPDAEKARWEEEERLAYVALTRARSRLVLAWFDEGEPRSFVEGPYAVLQDSLRKLGPEVRSLPPSPTHQPAPKSRAERPDPAPSAAVAPPRFTRPGATVTSYSELKRRPGDGDELPEPPTDPLPDDGLPGGAQVGKCLHHLLETADFAEVRSLSDPDQLLRVRGTWVREGLRRYGLPPGLDENVSRLVHRTLHRSWDLFGEPVVLCHRERVARELDFLFDPGFEDPVWVRGFVDLVLEVGGRLVLVDYKSDRLPAWSSSALQAHVDTHYGLQAKLYGEALDRHRQAVGSDVPIAGTAFLFLRAPTDGDPATGRVLCPHGEAPLEATLREIRGVAR